MQMKISIRRIKQFDLIRSVVLENMRSFLFLKPWFTQNRNFLIIILLMQIVNPLLMNMFQNAKNFLCTIPARLLNMEIN